jgi:CheY-like chemotaxis protein
VDSAVGRGSTFWFTVVLDKQRSGAGLPTSTVNTGTAPIALAPPAVDAGPASPAQREFKEALGHTGRSSINILLVEDNSSNLRVTQALLEAIGCTVATARNGLEAVSSCRAATFDLILMDCQMPEMDGYEATRAIRQLEAFQKRNTPIVALTAHAMDGSRDLSMAAGMNDHLTKPLTLSVLTTKLVEWLGNASGKRA